MPAFGTLKEKTGKPSKSVQVEGSPFIIIILSINEDL